MEQIRLNLIPTGPMPTCHASQYDKKREIGLVLFNGTRPLLLTDETLELDVRKSDSHIVTIDVPTPEGTNLAVFETTEQMCAVAGSNECELRIKKAGSDIGSLNFIMEIERSPMENGLASDSEIANLRTQMQAIAEPMLDDLVPPMVETLVPEVVGDDYYTKTQVDDKLSEKANADDVYQKTETYSKTETDNLVSPKADKTYVDTQLQAKANASDVYTKSQTDNLLNGKANASDVYTKQTIDALLNDKADVTDLPDMSQYYDKGEVDDLLDDKANSDDVYGKAYIDTALSGKANVGTSYTKSEEDALLANKADKSDTYTKEQVDDIVSNAIYNVLPDDTASGSVANFETDLALPIKSLEVDVNAVQSGSGEPSPDNVRPISGWDNITVSRTGKNLLPRLAETVTSRAVTFTPLSDGKIRINGTAQGGVATCDVGRGILLLPAGTYYVNETVSTYTITVFKIVGGTATPIKSGGGSFTLTETTSVFVRIAVPQNTTVTNLDVALQLELGSAATTYEPYNGTSVVIPFGDTYYGGVLDVVRGKLRLTHQYKDLGSFTWVSETSAVSGLFRTTLTNCKWRSVMLCSAYKYSSTTLFNQMNDLEIALTNSEAFPLLRCRNVAYDTYTATQFKNAVMGVQLVYELATPIEIDLTPAQITTLIGTNNIYADTGDTSVVFKDSVNGYVEKKIASVQALALNT